MFRELSVAEQRYLPVLSVIEDGVQVTEAAAKVGVVGQALHSWLSDMPRVGWRRRLIVRIGGGRVRIR